MTASKFLFVGNRRFVLEEILRHNLNLSEIAVISGTHLERDFKQGIISTNIEPKIIGGKQELIQFIKSASFDILISNGCPYILPIADLPSRLYINIHPSYLPDLRGADPAIGSILYSRDCGATCHYMDNTVDTGPIIDQVLIPYSHDLDVTTLYQLTFIAEKQVFSTALHRNFSRAHVQSGNELISYSRKASDKQISFCEPNSVILSKIKAFNNLSSGAEFKFSGNVYRVYAAAIMHNTFLVSHVKKFPPCTVAMSYENDIIFHKDGDVIRFIGIVSNIDKKLGVGDQLLES